MLFGIAGPTASGKTTVTNFLITEYNAQHLRYSTILADIATNRGLDPTDKATLQNLYVSLREEQGEDWLTNELAARAKSITTPHLVIEGNRRKVDIDTLQAVARAREEKLLFIFIDASLDTRFTRYNERLLKQNKSPIDHAAFVTLEANPAEDEVDDLRQYSKQHGIYLDTTELDVQATESKLRSLLNIQK